MTRQWLGLGVAVIFGGLALAALTATGDATGAPTRTASPVEIVNFPQVQSVTGTVSVGNFPAVQGVEVVGPPVEVAGTVVVANLPMDTSGNLKVAEQSGLRQPVTVDFQALESEKDALGNLPLIALEPGFRTVTVSVQSLDLTRARVESYRVGFGSGTGPTVRTGLGDFPLFPYTAEVSGLNPITLQISGTHLQIKLNSMQSGSGNPAPPDAAYLIHLYLSS